MLVLASTARLLFANTLNDSGEEITMMVISDVHLMHPDLLRQDGAAFERYVANDRKMLKESPVLLEEATQRILERHPRYLFIVGDLTKDGETISHEMLRDRYLSRFREAGIGVFVVPGNHDVDNPHAVEFLGDTTRRVATPTREEFAQIYADYGYGRAIARDTASLSYVVDLNEQVRLLCLDACKYYENDYDENICVTGGRIKDATVDFIKQQAADAKESGKRLIAMIHHGVVEHWEWQEKAMGEYLVDDWKKRADMLSKQGIEIVFTGHFHAQDIAKRGSLYDIETGSLVSYPSPIRTVTLRGNSLSVRTELLRGDSLQLPEGMTLTDYSREFARSGVGKIVSAVLPDEVPDSVKEMAGDAITDAYVAHLGGDEQFTSDDDDRISYVGKLIRKYSWKYAYIFTHLARNLWTDGDPEDTNIEIILKK